MGVICNTIYKKSLRYKCVFYTSLYIPSYFSSAAFFPLHLKLIIRLLLCHSSVPSHLLPPSIEMFFFSFPFSLLKKTTIYISIAKSFIWPHISISSEIGKKFLLIYGFILIYDYKQVYKQVLRYVVAEVPMVQKRQLYLIRYVILVST